MSRKTVLSVIIPVYNEEKTIAFVLDELLALEEVAEIILIDDGSVDNSVKVIEAYLTNEKIKLFKQFRNMGKGAAIKKGFEFATAPIVIVQDADLEYSPQDYKTILKPIIDGKADVVYGSRFQGGPGRVLYYRHELGNKLLTFLSNLLTDLNFTDIETCYKAFKREVIQNINLESDRFGIEVELTAKIAKVKGLRIYEVPISYNGRTYDEGKKITWKDGVAALWHIIKFNLLKSPKKFYKEGWEKILKK
jgi:glycosyltransferase involved in cell wall biosynthesis